MDTQRNYQGRRTMKRSNPEAMGHGGKKPTSTGEDFALFPQHGFNRCLMAGDSLIAQIAEDDTLNRVAYVNEWELVIERGGRAADIKRRLEGEGPLAGKHYLILWTGSNDLAGLTAEKLEDKNDIAKKARGIAYTAKTTAALATQRDTLVGIVVPPPRRDVSRLVHDIYKDQLTKVVDNMKGCKVIDLQREEESYDDFIRRNLREDGVHIKRHRFKDFLDTTLQLMGLTDIYLDKSLRMDDYIHRERCWVCGEKHLRETTGCDGRLLDCNRCTVRGHNHRICLHRAKLCTRCGERGHSNVVCRRGR